MKTNLNRSPLLLICLGAMMGFIPPKTKSGIEVSIIVNNANPTQALSPDFVRDFWLKKSAKRWREINKLILPVDRKLKCVEKDAFYAKILRLAPDVVEAFVSARQYQNGDQPIQKFNSDTEIIDYIAHEEGGIGYVNTESISPNEKKIKVIYTVSF